MTASRSSRQLRRRSTSTLAAAAETLLALLATGAPLAETLEAVCRAVEQRSPEWLASILLVDAKADSVWHGAAPTLPKGYIDALDGRRVSPT